ncbi:MAG: GntR family transcriptional regulator [Phycisphaerae bacterium]
MILNIDPHSGVPIYRQVMEQLKSMILSGVLAEGEQLPSVRELSGQLKVNPMTISKAYAYMELEGFFERRRGVGMFVNALDAGTRELKQTDVVKDAISAPVAQAVSFGITKDKLIQIVSQLHDSYRKG